MMIHDIHFAAPPMLARQEDDEHQAHRDRAPEHDLPGRGFGVTNQKPAEAEPAGGGDRQEDAFRSG